MRGWNDYSVFKEANEGVAVVIDTACRHMEGQWAECGREQEGLLMAAFIVP